MVNQMVYLNIIEKNYLTTKNNKLDGLVINLNTNRLSFTGNPYSVYKDNKRIKNTYTAEEIAEIEKEYNKIIEERNKETKKIIEEAKKIYKENRQDDVDYSISTDEQDKQGNPIDANGNLVLEDVAVEDLTSEDFTNPKRNVRLPKLPKTINDAIGAQDKPVIIKKNIFEKNYKSHKDLSVQDSRNILYECLYNADRYGQNLKTHRPYNWILIHLKDNQSAVIVEINPTKDNIEIINWHFIRDGSLKQKENQAIKEGGLILTLSKDNTAGNTANDRLVSNGKDTTNSETNKENAITNDIEFSIDSDIPSENTTNVFARGFRNLVAWGKDSLYTRERCSGFAVFCSFWITNQPTCSIQKLVGWYS